MGGEFGNEKVKWGLTYYGILFSVWNSENREDLFFILWLNLDTTDLGGSPLNPFLPLPSVHRAGGRETLSWRSYQHSWRCRVGGKTFGSFWGTCVAP